jgi:hypothetical protein
MRKAGWKTSNALSVLVAVRKHLRLVLCTQPRSGKAP